MKVDLDSPHIAYKVDPLFATNARDGYVLAGGGAARVSYSAQISFECAKELRALAELFNHLAGAESNIDPEQLSGLESILEGIARRSEMVNAALEDSLTLPQYFERSKAGFEELKRIRQLLVGDN